MVRGLGNERSAANPILRLEPMADTPSPPPWPVPRRCPPPPEVLKAALKAFKKRLKLTQLDDNSKIGRSPMSSGQRSTIAGITPPDQYRVLCGKSWSSKESSNMPGMACTARRNRLSASNLI